LGGSAIVHPETTARRTGVPYQNLVNLYLSDWARSGKRLRMTWQR
jgi:hypothetical protein